LLVTYVARKIIDLSFGDHRCRTCDEFATEKSRWYSDSQQWCRICEKNGRLKNGSITRHLCVRNVNIT